ncbi:MAG: hypothetical protein ACJAU0_000963 [Flavobacteriales bacterium]
MELSCGISKVKIPVFGFGEIEMGSTSSSSMPADIAQ